MDENGVLGSDGGVNQGNMSPQNNNPIEQLPTTEPQVDGPVEQLTPDNMATNEPLSQPTIPEAPEQPTTQPISEQPSV